MKKEPAAKAAAPGNGRLGIALVLGTLSAFGPFSLDMYLPALPIVETDLHTTTSLTQLSLTACLVGLALGQLLAGPLSDVRGRKLPLIVGLIVYMLASVLCMFSPNIWTFLALRLVQGLAGSAGIVISRAMVRDLYSGTELTKFFSLLMLINGIAPIAAPIAGGQLLAFTDWRGVFLVLGLIGLLALLAVLLSLPETLPPERRRSGGLRETLVTFKRIAADRTFMGYALSSGFVSAAMFAYISGSSFVLQNMFAVSPQMYSVIFAVNGLGIMLASHLTGRFADRVGERALLVTGLAMSSIGGLLLLAAIVADGGLFTVLAPLFFVVSSVGVVGTSSFSLAMGNQGEAAGSASALLGVLSFLIGGLIAPLVGLGGGGTALPMGLVIAISGLLAVLTYLLLARPGSKA